MIGDYMYWYGFGGYRKGYRKGVDLIYLATPYSKYPHGIERAFIDAAKVSAGILRDGHLVYSPIVHTHPLAIHGDLDPYDHAIWLPFDRPMMERADVLWVVMLEGWHNSTGIKHEIDFFQKHDKPVIFVNPSRFAEIER